MPGGAVSEGGAAGSDQLLPVLPSTESLSGLFAPSSDQAWLTLGNSSGGVIPFSFPANTGLTSLTAHITVLGQQITVTQAVDGEEIASYSMNEASWTGLAPQVIDNTGHGHDGTAIGGANTVFDSTFGYVGSFNGNGQYVTLSGSYSMSGARTVVAWVNLNASSLNSLGEPIITGGSSAGFFGDFFGISGSGGENSNLPAYELYIDDWGNAAYHSSGQITPDQWYQVAFTYDGRSNISFYINGAPAGTYSGGLYKYNFTTYTIGGNTIGGSTTNGSINGLLRDVSIYNYALNADSISTLYNQTKPGLNIISPASTTFTVGTANSFTVTATGSPTPTLSETGALPGGVTFTDNGDGTATLSGTPAVATAGTYALTFTASNGVETPTTQSFTLTVGQVPAITSTNNAIFTVGTAGSFTVTATGSPTPTLSETGALPSGVTFTAATGILSGTPAAGTGGTYPLTFTASNGVGNPASQSFTLTVNQALAITGAASATFTVGTAGSFTVTATGYPTPTLSETGALPSGVTFTAATGILSGTPGAGAGGPYPLTFTASNVVGNPASQSFTLTVNQAPAITGAASTTFAVGTAGSFTVTATGYPTPTLSETGALPTRRDLQRYHGHSQWHANRRDHRHLFSYLHS